MKKNFIEYFIVKKTRQQFTFLGCCVVLLIILPSIFLTRYVWFGCAASLITARDTSRRCDVIVFESWGYPQRYVMNAAFGLQKNGLGKNMYFTEYVPNEQATMSDVEIPKFYRQMLELYFESEGIDDTKIYHVPVTPKDPVTWNTAVTVIDSIANHGYRTMLLVSPWYHSQRSFEVYVKAGRRRGVEVYCKPAEGGMTRSNWWQTHAGMTLVFGEVVKLIYYQFRMT
jgi:uncharacterized SAM-binding protein YcdF (DUF218 family)